MVEKKPPSRGLISKAYGRLRGKAQSRARNEARRMMVIASEEDHRIAREVQGYTMTNQLRVQALLDAVDYIVERDIPGALAECGVWRGGSVLAMLRKLQLKGVTDRDIYLYDTFEGMTQPTEHDTSQFDGSALEAWQKAEAEGRRAWDGLFKEEVFREDAVRDLLLGTGYPPERLHFIKGAVEETLPDAAPESIALLRLDTDWYESTRHELECLYPKLSKGGVLIIDDYGHWEGCKRAVDEYFASDVAAYPLLNRIDYTARIAVKS